ncbi:hypothetical protein BJX68DRAFT_13311 [Aspergillus pseudodeflectus]|uniref:Uncharacterized protein n=1 Tax=Aspergillus pseudodeflectus TaxID=176178 RepID=A0ABR4LEN1_9EURO
MMSGSIISYHLYLLDSHYQLYSKPKAFPWANLTTTQCASRLHSGREAYFFLVRSVEDQNQTVFSRAASTPPWCSLYRTAGLFLRRTSLLSPFEVDNGIQFMLELRIFFPF